MENNSGLKPLGRAVLIKPYQPERLSSVIVVPDSAVATDQMVEQRAIVIELGEHCWPDEPRRADVGDRVLISKFEGEIEKRAAELRSSPEFRARVTLAIEKAIKE